MNIPNKVKIGGIIYAIDYTDRFQGGCDREAEIDYWNSTIEIKSGLGKQRTERNFFHEIVHAILDNTGFKDHDERVIDAIAGGLYALIKDNPEIFKE